MRFFFLKFFLELLFYYNKSIIFVETNRENMELVVDNIAKDKAKKVMDALFECMNDKSLSKEERKQ